MSRAPTILVVGTLDTKNDEILFLKNSLHELGATAKLMDVGVLHAISPHADITNHDVAEAAGYSLEQVARAADENEAMTIMAAGAARLAGGLEARRQIDGVVMLGGTMGTDLALDVAQALPMGMPKVVVSTIAFSQLLPPERLAPDLMMILWAGGLYGLNSICRSTLRQAAGAVYGAALNRKQQHTQLPRIGITSFGKSAAHWMVRLVPELEARGFEAAVFHATGMGGRALESLAQRGEFVAVMDFAVQEITNHELGSSVTAGPDRLTAAGLAGIPQIVAPGFIDLVDVPGWRPFPETLRDRPFHAHNRLLSALTTTAEERRRVVEVMADKLRTARAPTAFILPSRGVHEWDRPNGMLRDEAAMQSVNDACRAAVKPAVTEFHELDAHINDDAFTDTALRILDRWIAAGVVSSGQRREALHS